MYKSGAQGHKYSVTKYGANNGNNFALKINTVSMDAFWEEAKKMAEKLGGQYCCNGFPQGIAGRSSVCLMQQ
jgi:hypothetical protein